MDVVAKMGMSAPLDADKKLPLLKAPALVVMGDRDPDWADPKAEAEGIVATMPAGARRDDPRRGPLPPRAVPRRGRRRRAAVPGGAHAWLGRA